MKDRLEQLTQNEDNGELMEQLRMELENMRRSKDEEINRLKLQHENTMNEITVKCQLIEERLNESNNKCEEFEQQIESDKQSMISLSNQHKQV